MLYILIIFLVIAAAFIYKVKAELSSFNKENQMQSGELIVTGKDEVFITLHGTPINVNVYFKGDCDLTPCNPKDYDMLEWEMHFKHHHYTLKIKWNVSGVRKILWTAGH